MYQKVDRLIAIGLGAYLLQVNLSMHRAFGHPRQVLTNYLRDHSAVPGEVCDFFWNGRRLTADDRLSGVAQLLRLRLMNLFRGNPVVNASLFSLANDVLRNVANYLDDGQASIGVESNELWLQVAFLEEELRRTFGPRHDRVYERVEHFNQSDHKQFQSIDEIVERKWPF